MFYFVYQGKKGQNSVLNLNKRLRGLDTLLTKLLHQHNFHFGRDPPRDASNQILAMKIHLSRNKSIIYLTPNKYFSTIHIVLYIVNMDKIV